MIPAHFDRLTLKLTVTIVIFAVLTSAAPAVLVTRGFTQAQSTATDGSKRGLEDQGRAALLRLTQREAQLSAARLVQAARAGQTAAQYLSAMARRGTGAWSVARQLRRKPGGQYWDPNPARRSAIFIPRSVPIDAAVLSDVRDSAALDALVPALLPQVPNTTAMYYISPHGVMRYYSHPVIDIAQALPPDYPILYAASYAIALPLSDPGRTTVWRTPYLGPEQQGVLVTASTPVYVGKEFRGVIAVDVSLTGLIRHLATLKPTPSGYAFLVDSVGRLVAAPPSALGDLVGRSALPSGISITTLLLGLSLTLAPTAALRQTFGAMRRGQQGIRVIQLGGRQVLLSYAPLRGVGWSLGLVAPIDVITQQAAKVRGAIGREASATFLVALAVLSACFALVLLAALWLSRRELLGPIHRLMAATRAISAGDLNVSIPITRRDEFGQLARSFNTMSAELVRLVRQQQAEARERERLAQELHVARLVQTTLLPKELPTLPGWRLAAHYQPARQVAGDFYDFLALPDGCLSVIIGDVAEKGVPAALVMATTRTVLRGAAQRLVSPGQVLERANELLCPDMPPNMFVTCFYAILDPASGQLQYANAGHDLPYLHHADGVTELHARGMPLGLMPGMRYEEQSITIAPGESLLLYSDGLVEAHNPQREMFSLRRVHDVVAAHPLADGTTLIPALLAELERFTGAGWAQEDDITLVTLQRRASPTSRLSRSAGNPSGAGPGDEGSGIDPWRTVTTWTVSSAPGTERRAVEQVAAVVQDLALPAARLERLKTAVGEAVANAIEHGNQNRPELPVALTVRVSATALCVRVTDQGGGLPQPGTAVPELEAKLAGEQTPRGWGLFLIKNLVDEVHDRSSGTEHTIDLLLYRQGDEQGDATP